MRQHDISGWQNSWMRHVRMRPARMGPARDKQHEHAPSWTIKLGMLAPLSVELTDVYAPRAHLLIAISPAIEAGTTIDDAALLQARSGSLAGVSKLNSQVALEACIKRPIRELQVRKEEFYMARECITDLKIPYDPELTLIQVRDVKRISTEKQLKALRQQDHERQTSTGSESQSITKLSKVTTLAGPVQTLIAKLLSTLWKSAIDTRLHLCLSHAQSRGHPPRTRLSQRYSLKLSSVHLVLVSTKGNPLRPQLRGSFSSSLLPRRPLKPPPPSLVAVEPAEYEEVRKERRVGTQAPSTFGGINKALDRGALGAAVNFPLFCLQFMPVLKLTQPQVILPQPNDKAKHIAQPQLPFTAL
ncbi:uncharacterized protein BDR25DRAFT_356334 [Lindgomyces ingoldianus]|uniref:Uncharacterized protein n=1 Tax=Lindgomyces ingoldianus TaxID=673940 RepID=A0ACB6QRJ2_9PLEO|nr:uncharacterized protein BDR25DRAFT_356334 [Lindgomyces ingoldianus]KAF2469604.1 hypothetical protein BDR25DRAFT_356334 [Lindgomyces ingoldianus]